MRQEVIASRECDVCREALLIVRENDDRTIALNREDLERHVCFDLPADANLLVMEDPDERQ